MRTGGPLMRGAGRHEPRVREGVFDVNYRTKSRKYSIQTRKIRVCTQKLVNIRIFLTSHSLYKI